MRKTSERREHDQRERGKIWMKRRSERGEHDQRERRKSSIKRGRQRGAHEDQKIRPSISTTAIGPAAVLPPLTFLFASSLPVPLTRTTMVCCMSCSRTASMIPSATTLCGGWGDKGE